MATGACRPCASPRCPKLLRPDLLYLEYIMILAWEWNDVQLKLCQGRERLEAAKGKMLLNYHAYSTVKSVLGMKLYDILFNLS